MGITFVHADAIIGAHLNQPLNGSLLILGRQSVKFTLTQAIELLRRHGIEPAIAPEDCEFDHETRIGGEGQPTREGDAISDKSFFRMFGVNDIQSLDHSAYEGAEVIVDLNEPLPEQYEEQFDFIINGGTLDNIFNPAQAMMNIARMLRPGGRVLSYGLFTNHYSAYVMLPHQWYLDFFAVNQFASAQTYYCLHEANGVKTVYQVNLAKRAASRETITNLPTDDARTAISVFGYAVKGVQSTWNRQPSQEIYRSDEEWKLVESAFRRFAESAPTFPILKSTGTMPIIMPGRDNFEHVDADGSLATEHSRADHHKRLRDNLLCAMRLMNSSMGNRRWGILETGRQFFELIAEAAEAREIVSRPNVILFDPRMLNETTMIAGVRKEIYPAATALMLDIPILVVSDDPQIDAMWRRISRYFRHGRFFAGMSTQDHLVDYFNSNARLSVSIENGEFKGLPLDRIDKIVALLRECGPQSLKPVEAVEVRNS